MTDPVVRFSYTDDDGRECEAVLPARYVVCPRCSGGGTLGRATVCDDCGGAKILLVVNEELADPELTDIYNEQLADEWAYQHERKM